MEQLKKYYERATLKHDQCLQVGAPGFAHGYFKTNMFDAIEESYYASKIQFAEYLNRLEETEKEEARLRHPAATEDDARIPAQYSAINAVLPKMNLPIFDGKIENWGDFRDLFRSVIHSRTTFNPVDKLYYLRAHTRSAASRIVQQYSLIDENYAKAWEELCSVYDNQRRMVNSCLFDFFAVKPMKSECHVELDRVKTDSLTPINSLISVLKRGTSLGEDFVVFSIVRRFDLSTRKEWEKTLGKSKVPPTLEQLKDFIETQLSSLEAIEQPDRVKSQRRGVSEFDDQTSKSKGSQSVYSTSHNSQVQRLGEEDVTCPLCSSSHPLRQCPVYLSKPAVDRRVVVTKKKLCFNCLGNHPVNRCQSFSGVLSVKGSITLLFILKIGVHLTLLQDRQDRTNLLVHPVALLMLLDHLLLVSILHAE